IPLRWGDLAVVWQGEALDGYGEVAELDLLQGPDDRRRMTGVKGVEWLQRPVIQGDRNLGEAMLAREEAVEDQFKMHAGTIHGARQLRLCGFRFPVADSVQLFPDDERPVLAEMIRPGYLGDVTGRRDLYQPVISGGDERQVPDRGAGRTLAAGHH